MNLNLVWKWIIRFLVSQNNLKIKIIKSNNQIVKNLNFSIQNKQII